MAPALPGLYAGRALNGVAAGLAIAALPAYLAGLAGSAHLARASVFAVAANPGGQAVGTILAGVLSDVAPRPLTVPYGAGLLLLAPVALGHPDRRARDSRPGRTGQPGTARTPGGPPPQLPTPYRAVAVTLVAVCAMLGFLTALAGQILARRMNLPDRTRAGLMTSALFVTAALGQFAAGAVRSARARSAPLVLAPAATVALSAARCLRSLPLPLLCVAIALCGLCGLGVGICLRAGTTQLLALTPAGNGARVSSRLYAAVDLGPSLPTVAGLVATEAGPTHRRARPRPARRRPERRSGRTAPPAERISHTRTRHAVPGAVVADRVQP